MKERDKIKLRIVALLNKTKDNGASKNEAISAAQKAAQLMEHYDINADELDFKNYSCKRGEVRRFFYGKADCMLGVRRGLANLCDVVQWATHKKTIGFIGLGHDVEVFEHLVNVLRTAMQNELAQFKKTNWYKLAIESQNARSVVSSFLYAMDNELERRLHKMAEEKHNNVVRQTGTALVCVKQEKIKEEMQDLGIRLVSRNVSRFTRSTVGAISGREAAGNININGAVKSGNAPAAGLLK